MNLKKEYRWIRLELVILRLTFTTILFKIEDAASTRNENKVTLRMINTYTVNTFESAQGVFTELHILLY